MLRPASLQRWLVLTRVEKQVLVGADPGMVLVYYFCRGGSDDGASFLKVSQLCCLPRCGLAGSLSSTSQIPRELTNSQML